MQNALYPKRFDNVCPYCGSKNIQDPLNFAGTTEEINVKRHCDDCGRSHHLNYEVTSVTLEDGDGLADTNFHYPLAELQDQGVDEPAESPAVPVGIYAAPDGIMVMAAGYGDGASSYGYGSPIIIENYNGHLRVVVWNDINDDDASQIIELGNARYSQENSVQGYPFRAQRFTPDGVQIEEHQFVSLENAIAFASDKLTAIPKHYAVVRDNNHDREVWDNRHDEPFVKKEYEGGICPDCGEVIPDDATPGDDCQNCGHVWSNPQDVADARRCDVCGGHESVVGPLSSNENHSLICDDCNQD